MRMSVLTKVIGGGSRGDDESPWTVEALVGQGLIVGQKRDHFHFHEREHDGIGIGGLSGDQDSCRNFVLRSSQQKYKELILVVICLCYMLG